MRQNTRVHYIYRKNGLLPYKDVFCGKVYKCTFVRFYDNIGQNRHKHTRKNSVYLLRIAFNCARWYFVRLYV